ncbi:MAG: hypothetical protein KGH63_00345 [Candidatus Micrarchaeota archaeon]|nr:hypothetical protein [Candidatus Micrarchaeota archaeon]
MDLPNPYSGDYRRLIIVPVLLVLLSLAVILFVSPIRQGIDFKGGIDITVLSNHSVDVAALKKAMAGQGYVVETMDSQPNPTGFVTQITMPRSDVLVQADAIKASYFALSDTAATDESNAVLQNSSDAAAAYAQDRVQMNALANQMFNLSGQANASGASYNSTSALDNAVITAFSQISDRENARLRSLISSQIPQSTASFNEVTSSLSATFLDKALMVVLYSILLTSVVVFIIFRDFTPSVSVLAGAAADVLIAMGAMGLLGIPLTLASFAALLMLVGFSLDTDVLLAMRVLKHKDSTARGRAFEAMKTGMTMSLSAIVAFSALFVLASVTHIAVYYEISAVALAGLVGDLVATWLFNAVIVLHHQEEREKKGGAPPARPLASYIFKN